MRASVASFQACESLELERERIQWKWNVVFSFQTHIFCLTLKCENTIFDAVFKKLQLKDFRENSRRHITIEIGKHKKCYTWIKVYVLMNVDQLIGLRIAVNRQLNSRG